MPGVSSLMDVLLQTGLHSVVVCRFLSNFIKFCMSLDCSAFVVSRRRNQSIYVFIYERLDLTAH